MFKPTRHSIKTLAATIALVLAGTGSAAAADWSDMKQEARDAYRHGQIWATYATNPTLEALDIDVDVEGDTVTLQGTVETFAQKRLAETIARSTDDVAKVDNKLRVDPEFIVVTTMTPMRTYSQRVADATVAANVDSMLLWNDYTDGLDINVDARAGVVTLSGVADTEGAKRRAGDIALQTTGVNTVVNNLRVDGNSKAKATAEVDDDWIEDKIADSYLYSILVNSMAVDVDANDGEVTLSGKVMSPFERERAIQIAQDTRGVERVDASGLVVSGRS